MESTFSLEFSFAELRWLAGAFSMANIPLSIPPVSPEALMDAQISLEKRKIIEPGQPAGWEIHPFVAMTLQWMAGSSRFWVFDCYRRDSQDSEFALFLQNQAALLVLPILNGKQLIACQNMDTAITEWLLAINLTNSNTDMKLPEWDSPQPLTVIRNTWKNPAMAKTMADAEFLTWAAGLDWAGEWAMVIDKNRFARLVLAARGQALWVGSYSQGRPGEFPLKPNSTNFLTQTLMQIVNESV